MLSGMPEASVGSVAPKQSTPGVVVADDVASALRRDALLVASKCSYIVSLPAYSEGLAKFKNWDYWGPMSFSLLLSLSLYFGGWAADPKAAFSVVFFAYWLGAGLIAVTATMLGAQQGVMSLTSTILYSTFPMTVAALILCLIPHYGLATMLLRLVIISPAAVWGGLLSIRYAEKTTPQESRLLVRFPVCIYFFGILSMVLIG
eukprot:GHVH01005049.1.p1 GENE.GHVH01005049.1~~GHVH01005049.1.p1  ORF type:complete len:203 (-),score=16.02 GHVH01005049.1:151-759(-)